MLKRIHQHLFLIFTVLFAVLVFFFQMRLSGDSAKVSDMAALIVCCAFFCWAAIAGFLEELERKLNKWLEPKTGYALQVDLERHKLKKWQESIEGYAQQASAPTDTYPQRSHRHDLEKSLVHALAPYLVNTSKATDLGAYIRAAADAILGAGQTSDRLDAAKLSLQSAARRAAAAWESVGFKNAKCRVHGLATCACSQAADDLRNSAGFQSEQKAEAEIVAAGLTAPRVTGEQIQALMATLSWRYDQPEGTTSTFAHAFLGRFYLVTGHSGCVSPENFDAALGMKYAREQAEGKARDKLWELEGYKLASKLQGEAA